MQQVARPNARLRHCASGAAGKLRYLLQMEVAPLRLLSNKAIEKIPIVAAF
jgi:hypothetical protein